MKLFFWLYLVPEFNWKKRVFLLYKSHISLIKTPQKYNTIFKEHIDSLKPLIDAEFDDWSQDRST